MEKQEFILQCNETKRIPIPRFGPILQYKYEALLQGKKEAGKDWPMLNSFWIYTNPMLELGKKYKLTIEEHKE